MAKKYKKEKNYIGLFILFFLLYAIFTFGVDFLENKTKKENNEELKYKYYEIKRDNDKSIEVSLDSCIDGDTASFNYNNKIIKARFLAINTPEYSHENIENYGLEASTYTCNRLKEASKIVLEYDDKADKVDKYGRELVWVFLDDQLLQLDLVSSGFAKIKYIYGNYKYLDALYQAEYGAKQQMVGIWSYN